MCIRDPINKTCRKNGKDLSNGAPNIKLWNHTKKTHFQVFAKNFRRPCMKLKNFFCQFPNPWTLRVSGMGGYTSKCEKKSKSLHPSAYPLLEQVGGGWALEFESFWAMWNGIEPIGEFYLGPKKLKISRAQPCPTCPRNGYPLGCSDFYFFPHFEV